MALTPDDVKALMRAFEASDWSEMSVRIGDTTLELTRTGRPPLTAVGASPAVVGNSTTLGISTETARHGTDATFHPAPAAPVTEIPSSVPVPPKIIGHQVTAPSIGLFWRSSQPGAPSFVEVGQVVDANDTVCIVEIMKLMNHVKAGVSGTVVAIEAVNGQMIEFGQTLVVIRE